MKKILVTGGLGFLGVNLCNYLLSKQYKVVAVDDEDMFKREKYVDKKYKENFEVIYLNLLSKDLSILPKKVDYIIHLAAYPHVDFSNYYPDKTIINNVLSVHNILNYALQVDAEVIFTSSVEVYGGRENKCYDENQEMRPLSIYGCSKQMGESLVQYFIDCFSLKCSIVRLTNLFGPLQLPDRVIPRNICRLLDGVEIDLTADFYRDFLYVEDACAIIHLLIEKEKAGEIYNVSSGKQLLMQEVISELIEMFPDSRIKKHDFSMLNASRGKFLIIDNNKIKNIYTINKSFSDRLEETVKWYKNNSGWTNQFREMYMSNRDSENFIIDAKKLRNKLKNIL